MNHAKTGARLEGLLARRRSCLLDNGYKHYLDAAMRLHAAELAEHGPETQRAEVLSGRVSQLRAYLNWRPSPRPEASGEWKTPNPSPLVGAALEALNLQRRLRFLESMSVRAARKRHECEEKDDIFASFS